MSGSAYSPPTENLVDFNSSVFKTANEGTLTLSQAKGLFLGRTGTPNSVATTTTFTGGITAPTVDVGLTLSAVNNAAYFTNYATSRQRSVIIGSGAAASDDAISIGYNAGAGLYGVGVGRSANSNGDYSVAVGYNASAGATSSTAIGTGATATVANSVVLGTASETVYCTGTTANGSLVATSDIFINGVRAGKGNSTDITCSAFGRDALFTLSSIDTDNNNSAFGRNALKLFNRTNSGTSFAGNNTAIGTFSLGNITTGFRNTGCGTYTLGNITGGGVLPLSTGLRNTACGYAAGYNLSSAASDNTFVGCIRDSSSYTTGSNNTLIGSQIIFGVGGTTVNSGVGGSTALGAFTSFANFSNTTVIGGGTSTGSPGAVATASNQIMLGRATETVICPGTVAAISLNTTNNISINGAVFGVGAGGSNSLFTGLTTGGGAGAGMTIYGSGSYSNFGDGSSNRNTIFGALAMTNTLLSYNDVTVVGYGCQNTGTLSTTAEKITLIGATSSAANIESTAIGYGATATLANQIMLGRATETVYCPGTASNNSITLSGGITLQTAYSAAPSANQLGYQVSNISTGGFAIASFTTATPTNISAGISLATGVWCIEYTIDLLVSVAVATVAAQTLFVTLDNTGTGTYATRLSICGATRIHSTYTYGIGDTPAFSGSFSYYVTPADILYPKFQISYTAGPTISGTSYYTATRIA